MVTHPRSSVVGLTTLLVVAAACGSPEVTVDASPSDAGTRDDAGHLDAQVPSDAGVDDGALDAPPDAPIGSPCASDEECAEDEYCDVRTDVLRCAPDVCDPTPPGDRPTCEGLDIRQCRPNGSGYDLVFTCMGGRACVTLDAEPYAVCRCVQDGLLACESPPGNDVYEVDTCGAEVRRVEDCVLARRESCVVDELGDARCAPPTTCTVSSTCAPTDYCLDGACVPRVCTPPPIGNPNSQRFCEGNVVRGCAPDGSGFVVVEDCTATGGGRACVDLPSDPGADCRCVPAVRTACSGTDVWLFDSCGTATTRIESCDGATACVEGPAGPSCELRATCERDFDCGTGTGRICSSGLCVPRPCNPGTERCNGARIERCDTRGATWEVVDDCVGGESCTVAGGVASCTCSPDAYLECHTNDVYNFDSCGNRGTRAVDCTAPEVCVSGPTGPGCVDTSTPPTGCVGDIDCGTGEVCLDGACADRVCTPSAVYCESGSVRRCDARGAGSALVDDCDGGQVCTDASGEARCLCVAGVRTGCSGGDVYEFDSCERRGSLVDDCSAGCVEVAGVAACETPPPPPPAPTCTARASMACYGGDVAWLDSCGVPTEIAEVCPGTVFCNTIGGPADCRSSVADVTSPYWERSCPLVQDVELPTDLPDARDHVGERTPQLSGLTAIDLATGDRTEAFCRPINPDVPWRDICLGGVLEGGFQNEGGFWIDPANGDPIVVHESHGLVRVDLRNGNSMRFSL